MADRIAVAGTADDALVEDVRCPDTEAAAGVPGIPEIVNACYSSRKLD